MLRAKINGRIHGADLAIYDSPDFQRAYDIHGKHYEGKDVTDDEQEFFEKYLKDLLESHKDGGLPFGVTIWVMYAVKYI